MDMSPEIVAVTESLPVAELYIHPLNPRAEAPEAEIEALAENIRALGLIQNLAGLRDAEGRVGIVAGGRRLRALTRLVGDPRFAAVPVKIAPDADTAATWAAAENHARADLHPADEIREYASLRDRGAAEAAIAIAFGVTRDHVRRRLRLAGLPAPVLAALRADKIGLSEAAAFVLCDDERRIAEVLARVIAANGNMSAASIKSLLKQGAARDTDRRARFLGVPAYRAAGGRISSDLFGGEVYLDDADILDAVFAARLAEVAEETRARDGWKWVAVDPAATSEWDVGLAGDVARLYPTEGMLSEAEAAHHDERAMRADQGDLSAEDAAELERLAAILEGDYTPEQKAHAGVVLYVAYGGELRASPAMVLPEDQPGAAEAGIIAAPTRDAGRSASVAEPEGPKVSEALRQDLRAVRRGARQQAALAQPDLVLAMLAFHLNGAFGNRGFSLQRFAVAVRPTTGDEGYGPDPRLLDTDAGRSSATDLVRAFKAFRKKGAEHTRDVLTLELARLLSLPMRDDDPYAKLFEKEAAVDVRAVWTPTAANFFGRVPGAYLDALWCEMTGVDPESGEARAFAKAKKGEKAARLETMFDKATELAPEQRARVDAWLPPEMF